MGHWHQVDDLHVWSPKPVDNNEVLILYQINYIHAMDYKSVVISTNSTRHYIYIYILFVYATVYFLFTFVTSCSDAGIFHNLLDNKSLRMTGVATSCGRPTTI